MVNLGEVGLDLGRKLCTTWAELVELEADPDFRRPILGDPNDPMAWMLGTAKKWPPMGTATQQYLALCLEKQGFITREEEQPG